MLYDAAVFDLDGLLIDTERLAIAAGHETITALGFVARDSLFESLVGSDTTTATRLIAAQYEPAFPMEDFLEGWNRRFKDKLAGGIPLRPGALDLLKALAGIGLPCAVATSSRKSSAEYKLAMTGLTHHFVTVVSVDCITNPKPAPDPYLHAALRLGVSAARCIAFEDSNTGAAAARAAGMTVVQVPDMQKPDGGHAHHLAPDLMTGARLAGLI